MKISSGNSPAFGCGACKSLKQIAKEYDPIKVVGLPPAYQSFQDSITFYQKKNGLTHGQAASKLYKEAKGMLPMIKAILKKEGVTHL